MTVATGITGGNTPLNRPYNLDKGIMNGVRENLNGTAQLRTLLSEERSSDDVDEHEEVAHINGNSKPVSATKGDVISNEWPKEFRRPPGLRNFSNTCYMNSTLQALMHVPPLVAFFLGRGHTLHCTSDEGLC